jgi:hypothetical protein
MEEGDNEYVQKFCDKFIENCHLENWQDEKITSTLATEREPAKMESWQNWLTNTCNGRLGTNRDDTGFCT